MDETAAAGAGGVRTKGLGKRVINTSVPRHSSNIANKNTQPVAIGRPPIGAAARRRGCPPGGGAADPSDQGRGRAVDAAGTCAAASCIANDVDGLRVGHRRRRYA